MNGRWWRKCKKAWHMSGHMYEDTEDACILKWRSSEKKAESKCICTKIKIKWWKWLPLGLILRMERKMQAKNNMAENSWLDLCYEKKQGMWPKTRMGGTMKGRDPAPLVPSPKSPPYKNKRDITSPQERTGSGMVGGEGGSLILHFHTFLYNENLTSFYIATLCPIPNFDKSWHFLRAVKSGISYCFWMKSQIPRIPFQSLKSG